MDKQNKEQVEWEEYIFLIFDPKNQIECRAIRLN